MIIALGGETGLYYCLAVFAMCDSSDERGNCVTAVCRNDDGRLRFSHTYTGDLNLFYLVLGKQLMCLAVSMLRLALSGV